MSLEDVDMASLTRFDRPEHEHRCSTPADYKYRVLGWECGICGRVWAPHLLGWTEVRGPKGES